MKVIKKQLVVIGGGPAGMAAAISAKEHGISDILILEREDRMGGILNQCIHDGFGLIRFSRSLTGPEYAEIYLNKIKENRIEYKTGVMVTGITKEKQIEAISENGAEKYRAQAVVLATGCRERTRGGIGTPGSRPAGIYTAGSAQNFVNLKNLMVGKKIVIIGSGDIGLIMARRLTLEGADIIAVVEINPFPGGLLRNVVQCLEDYGIPLLLNHSVTNIIGKERVEAVEISRLDDNGCVAAGSARKYECDAVIISAGLIPENELAVKASVLLDDSTGGPVVDKNYQTCTEGIFSCGNSLYVHDLADNVSAEGEKTGKAAADYLLGRLVSGGGKLKIESAERAAMPKNAVICIGCPNSCIIEYETADGEITIKGGARCEKGKRYAEDEIINPLRILTTSIKVLNGELPLVSVRTTGRIPKSRLFEAVSKVKEISVSAPVYSGQIIAENFLETGFDLIATKTVKAV